MNLIFIILMILSFLLDGIISNIVNEQGIFLPLISIMSIIVLNRYKIDTKSYLFYVGLIGLFYDIIYTSTPVLNMFIFLLLGIITIYLNKVFINNIFSNILIGTILIIIYRILIYIILYLVGNINFDINVLFKSIYCSLLTNYIYLIIMYFIVNKIKNYIRNKNKIMKF